MNRINCICKIEDEEFRNAFELQIMSSRYFLLNNEDVETKGKTIVFFDENCDQEADWKVFLSPYRHNSNLSEDGLEIFKYSPFSELEKEVVSKFGEEFYQKEEPRLMTSDEAGVETISFFSLSGGSGTTTLALRVARELYRNGAIPFYLSITPVTSWLTTGVAENSINDEREIVKFLYDIRKKRLPDIKAFTSRVGDINTIGSPLVNRYSGEIMKAEIAILEKSLKASGYDILILDCGNNLTEERIDIIGYSGQKVHVLSGNSVNLGEMKNEVKNIFGRNVFNVINHRTEENHNHIDNDSVSNLNTSMDIIIPYFDNLDELTMDGEYGDYIRFLVSKIEQRMEEGNGTTGEFRKKTNGGNTGKVN